jgi:hypothetical protein
MNEFLATAFTMPTAIFSVLVALLFFYWFMVILGALDLEILDGVFDLVEGLFGGGVDAAEGMIEGALEGAVEGVAEGVAEGLGEVAGERSGCLGMSGVPLSIVGTFFAAFGWVFSYLGLSFLPATGLALGGTALVVLTGVGATVLALGATMVATRPIKKLFRLAPVTQNSDLVGRVATITTLTVDERFGQALVDDEGGSPILIQARSRETDSGLTRGTKALIFEYDRTGEVFYVAPYDEGTILE